MQVSAYQSLDPDLSGFSRRRAGVGPSTATGVAASSPGPAQAGARLGDGSVHKEYVQIGMQKVRV
jgi:hypothetical protein